MTKTTKGDRKGQALAELGIIVTVLITITLGVVEFGYAFFALHMVTQATAAGARAASVLQVGNRDACGILSPVMTSSNGPIANLVRSQVGNVVTVTDVKIQQCDYPGCQPPATTPPCSPSSMPRVRVTVTGTVPRVFRLFGSSPVSFSRVQTFRDEGR